MPMVKKANIMKFIKILFFLLFVTKVLLADNDVTKYSKAIQLLSEYIGIESVSGNENEAAYFMAKKCRDAGFVVEYINDQPGSVNFAASLYPLSWGKPNIIFHNHMDVVPEGKHENWNYTPYGGVVDSGKVWGRGSMDNKGLAIIQFFAVSNFMEIAYEKELPFNVTILFVSGEETGGETGSMIVSNVLLNKFSPAVVIGEGGAGMDDLGFLTKKNPVFGITIAEKQNVWLKLSWKTDVAGHASIAEGDYASMLMINGLHKLLNSSMPVIVTQEAQLMFSSLGEVVGGVKGSVMKKPDSKVFRKIIDVISRDDPEIRDLVTNKITLTSIDGGTPTAINQSSNIESAFLDVRLLPGTSVEEIIAYIHEVVDDSVLEIEILTEGAASRGTMPEYFFDMLADALVGEYKNSKVIPMLFPASTDNNFFRKFGVPVYGLNPFMVSGEQLKAIHNYNEFIDVEDVDRGISVFTSFLSKVLDQE